MQGKRLKSPAVRTQIFPYFEKDFVTGSSHCRMQHIPNVHGYIWKVEQNWPLDTICHSCANVAVIVKQAFKSRKKYHPKGTL